MENCVIPTANKLVWIVHYEIPVASQPPSSPNYLLRSSSSYSIGLLGKIAQSFLVNPQVCCMLFLKFSLVLADRFISMHVSMSPYLVGVRPPLSSSGSMASKRAGSKDTDGSATRTKIEWVSTSFLIYEDTKLIVDKDIKLKWQEVNDAFAGTFWEDLKDANSMWTFTSLSYTGLHAGIPCSHAWTWYILLSHTLILRWWH